MTYPVIAIIGAGNMGASLIGGMAKLGHPPENIWASDLSAEKLASLHHTYRIHTTTDNQTAIEAANVVIFAVKPQVFESIATPLQSIMQTKKPLVISIAAGIQIASIQAWLGGNLPIIRAMPNTPALIGIGASAYFANDLVSASQQEMTEKILKAVGIVVPLSHESLIDTVTAVSGSGPAYFFLMMEAMIDAGTALGLPKETAKALTLQTALGAAKMAIESDLSLTTLREQVTSKGGTTEKAVSVLEQEGLRAIFKAALLAAKTRSEALARSLEGK